MLNSSRTEQKKLQKKERLNQAAYDIFSRKGFLETSVDEIVRQADVAKGTFYLYYRDKGDLLREIIRERSEALLLEAFRHAKRQAPLDPLERLLIAADEIIERCRKNLPFLRMARRAVTCGMLYRPPEGELRGLLNEYTEWLCQQGRTSDEACALLYMVVELVGSACYTSITDAQPIPIDRMKPLLFEAIWKLLA